MLLNCITNDFLQHGYSLYGPLPLFPHPTTLGDPSTPRTESFQVNLSFTFKSESKLLNMTRFCVKSHGRQQPGQTWSPHMLCAGVEDSTVRHSCKMLLNTPVLYTWVKSECAIGASETDEIFRIFQSSRNISIFASRLTLARTKQSQCTFQEKSSGSVLLLIAR
jgi:hypothetical protein